MYPSFFWRVVLALFVLSIVLSTRAAPIPLHRDISIPSGACYADAIIVYNLANYFISNYVIHASAIPVGADIGRYAQRVTRQDGWLWHLWLAIISLFLPFFALARTTILIAQQLRCKGNGVLAALQHGALLVVVRAKGWKPGTKDEIIYTRLPEGFSFRHGSSADAEAHLTPSLPAASIVFDSNEKGAYEIADRNQHMLHGTANPPPGYALAIPMRKGHTQHLIERHLNDTSQLKVHYRPGAMGIVLSLIQIGIGTYNVYTARSSQIPRWGYAAYSLSVLPYVIMSVMNVLCAAIVDSYACAQLLRTPILEESLRRGSEAPRYDGTIGTVRKESSLEHANIGREGQEGYVSVAMRIVAKAHVSEEENDQGYLIVTGDGGQASAYRFRPNDTGVYEDQTEKKLPEVLAGEKTCLKDIDSEHRSSTDSELQADGPASAVRFTVSALSHDGPAPHEKVQELDAVSRTEAITIACLFLIAMILPHVVIYALTGFRANQSSLSQRAWMMAWLAADQFSTCSTLACWVLWKKRQNVIPDWLQKSFYAVLMIAGAGGFVEVGYMYLQDHEYGLQKCAL